MFARALGDQAMKAQEEVIKKRSSRVFEKGDIVFRSMPSVSRPPKHTLGEPNRGPVNAVEQRTLASAMLMDSVTNALVDGGPWTSFLRGPGVLRTSSSPRICQR